jgi:hypothetical protein
MARKHPISPNQTVLWTWHSLSPAWGSRALHEPQEKTRKSPRGTTKTSRTTGGKTRAQAKKTTSAKVMARPSTGRQTSGRNRSQQDATSKNEQVSAGAQGNRSRSPQPSVRMGLSCTLAGRLLRAGLAGMGAGATDERPGMALPGALPEPGATRSHSIDQWLRVGRRVGEGAHRRFQFVDSGFRDLVVGAA